MAGVYSQLLTVQGRPARVWRGGAGKPLVLLHGGLGDAATHWRWCWQALADSFAVYAPDLPGFGGMTSALPEPGYQGFVDWTLAAMDALQLTQAVLIGNSFGGAIARLLAAQQPARVSHLILANGGRVLALPGFVRALANLPGISGLVYNMAERSAGSPKTLEKMIYDKSRLTPEFVAETRKALDGFSAAMRRTGRQAAPSERTPRCPTLVLWGTQDRFATPKAGEKLVKELGGTVTWRPMENSGHMPQMEQSAAFVSAVREFVG